MLQDETLRLSLHYHAQSTTLEFTDHRADYHTTRDFAGRIVPCARDSQGDVLLLQQFSARGQGAAALLDTAHGPTPRGDRHPGRQRRVAGR